MEEDEYERGKKTVWRELLALAISNLAAETPDAARLMLERAQTVAALRIICEEHGSNDWPDDLHLADVLDKHLARHL